MKKFLYIISFIYASINNSYAVIIGDEILLEESGSAINNFGACQILKKNIIFDRQKDQLEIKIQSANFGNAVLIGLDDNGNALGITAAHCLKANNNTVAEINVLLKQPNSTNIKGYNVKDYWSNPKQYNSIKKNSEHDIGLFHVTLDSQNLPRFFMNTFYEQPLQDQQMYDVRIGSFGPSFSNQLSSYRENQYHEVSMRITYDAREKLFYKISESRDFYFIFFPNGDGSYEWKCDLLPMAGDSTTTRGDSGSLVTTSEGQALALVSATNFNDFYKDNQKLASYLLDYKKDNDDKFFDENEINNLVNFLNTHISDPKFTTSIQTDDKKKIYRFTLKEEFKSIISREYFTPLMPYLSTIRNISSTLKGLLSQLKRINDMSQQLNSIDANGNEDLLNKINVLKEENEKTKNDIILTKSIIFESL